MTPRKRVPIPPERAAQVLFSADRTCCVCRVRGKPVQIHHIDEDPSNNRLGNLAVLCLDCHRETQIRGGFDRKLDGEQVTLYRDDWHRVVAHQRSSHGAQETLRGERDFAFEMSIAEIYRENQEYELLALHYEQVGNVELRDKYIELTLADDHADTTVVFLRGLQGRPELIPPDVIEREEHAYEQRQDWLQRARFRDTIGRSRTAVEDYLRGITGSLQEGRVFSAAYYLKELSESGLIESLFIEALAQAREEGSLWWQIRAFEELEWYSELDAFLVEHAAEIEGSDDLLTKQLLARAQGDRESVKALRKEIARSERLGGVVDDDAEEEQDDEPG